MRGIASLKGNTLPVRNVINCLEPPEYLYVNDFAKRLFHLSVLMFITHLNVSLACLFFFIRVRAVK